MDIKIDLSKIYIRSVCIDENAEDKNRELHTFLNMIRNAPEFEKNRIEEIDCANMHVWVICDDIHAYGYICSAKYGIDSACICYFIISDMVRNLGIGSVALKLFTKMLVKMDEKIDWIYLFVDADNPKSVNFYKKNCKYWLYKDKSFGCFNEEKMLVHEEDSSRIYEGYTYISPKLKNELKQTKRLNMRKEVE